MVEMALRNVYKKYDNAEHYSVTDFNLEITDRELSSLSDLLVAVNQQHCE